jgi:hypothetical protein
LAPYALRNVLPVTYEQDHNAEINMISEFMSESPFSLKGILYPKSVVSESVVDANFYLGEVAYLEFNGRVDSSFNKLISNRLRFSILCKLYCLIRAQILSELYGDDILKGIFRESKFKSPFNAIISKETLALNATLIDDLKLDFDLQLTSIKNTNAINKMRAL